MKGLAFAFAGGSAVLLACAVHDDTTFPNWPQPTETTPPVRTVGGPLDDAGAGGVDPGGTTNTGVGITSIGTGYYHACAVVDDYYGQLGDNSTTDKHVPVQVLGAKSGVAAVVGGADHTCALVNGGVQCWGFNDHGQLGDNSTSDRHVPVQVAGLTAGVAAISAGAGQNCALVSGGVQCWGHKNWDVPDDNSTTDTYVPVAVSGLTSGVTAVAAGSHTCAVVNGGAQCWGSNFVSVRRSA
jgi:hypothetical protein